MPETYDYLEQVREQLARHGFVPGPSSSPAVLRDALRDLYRYEIRKLRDRMVRGAIPRDEYAGHVIELRKRYWLLSVPLPLWIRRD